MPVLSVPVQVPVDPAGVDPAGNGLGTGVGLGDGLVLELGLGTGVGLGDGLELELGLGTGLGLGLELLNTQLAVSVSTPLTHLVVPLTSYPVLHVGVHLLPE